MQSSKPINDLIELAKQDFDVAEEVKYSKKQENIADIAEFLNKYNLLQKATCKKNCKTIPTQILYNIYEAETQNPISHGSFCHALGRFTNSWGYLSYDKTSCTLTKEQIHKAKLYEAQKQLRQVFSNKR